MLVKQPQKKPHEDDPRGKDETHDVPTPPQEPQREAETQKTARTEIDAREKFERRKRAEKRSRETCRRPPKPADAGGSDLFFMPYGPRLPCFRFCGLYFRGAEYKQDFRTKKSAATYILRLIYLSEPEGPRSWLFSDPLP